MNSNLSLIMQKNSIFALISVSFKTLRQRLRDLGKIGGVGSKFGLSSVEIMEALDLIKEANLQNHLVMLHYHIGSQITEIKRVKAAMQEAARVYAKIQNSGFNLQYLNIGGGIGVDYDGSKTSFYVSRNYTLQEFANDVIYIIQDVCRAENCRPPHIVSESGRIVAAYHSVLITDVREVEKIGGELEDWKVNQLIIEFYKTLPIQFLK